MSPRKRKRNGFDAEILALRRMVRIVEEFPDVQARARLARYLGERYPSLERVIIRGETTEEKATRIWGTPLGSAFVPVEGDERQESLELAPVRMPCTHGSLLENCYGCEVERQVANERHSAPPVGGIAE